MVLISSGQFEAAANMWWLWVGWVGGDGDGFRFGTGGGILGEDN